MPTIEPADRSGTDDTSARSVFAPSGLPGAALAGVVVALALLVLCGVAVRDLVVAAGWTDGEPWLGGAAHWAVETPWQDWMWAAAVACVVVGVGLLVAAVKPRRPTHMRLAGHDVLWTRRVDVARRVSAAAESIAGVDHATTVVTRRKAVSTVTARGSTDRDRIREVVDAVAREVEPPLRTVVRAPSRTAGGRR